MKKCILIVEDDPAISRLIESNLLVAGYEPVCAMDGRQALDAIAAQHFDLELFPLKYASFEKDCVAVDLYVNKIQLGYMFVMSRNQPEYFELIPVWDFYGYEVYESRNGKNVYENAYTSLLTINAVDGTVIDRNYGY